jgi:hypothetical protein
MSKYRYALASAIAVALAMVFSAGGAEAMTYTINGSDSGTTTAVPIDLSGASCTVVNLVESAPRHHRSAYTLARVRAARSAALSRVSLFRKPCRLSAWDVPSRPPRSRPAQSDRTLWAVRIRMSAERERIA